MVPGSLRAGPVWPACTQPASWLKRLWISFDFIAATSSLSMAVDHRAIVIIFRLFGGAIATGSINNTIEAHTGNEKIRGNTPWLTKTIKTAKNVSRHVTSNSSNASKAPVRTAWSGLGAVRRPARFNRLAGSVCQESGERKTVWLVPLVSLVGLLNWY